MKTAHWADLYAKKIIEEKGEKAKYTVASGITPSGTVHIGNFREVISVELVARALKDAGKNVRFIYSWDNYDVFRKVPDNMPDQELLTTYLRQAITRVPDTKANLSSYARANEIEFEKYLPIVGIKPEFIDQSLKYMSSDYSSQIKFALDHKDEIAQVLNAHRTTKLADNWYPISIFCTKCNRDTTKVKNYNHCYSIEYCCECGNKESLDLRKTWAVKLPWRIDWPMRWKYENVDFEPAGKDHHSSGGSFDTSKEIVKIFGGTPPVTFQYDFISIKGRGGKISSSSGDVISLKDVLEIYTPEVTRFLFASTKPNTEFSISFDLDVIKIYEDYDKFERVYYGIETIKENKKEAFKRIYELSQPEAPDKEIPYQIGFRHLSVICQIFEGDKDKILNFLNDVKESQKAKLISKINCAINWIKKFAPEDFKFSLRSTFDNIEPLKGTYKQGVTQLLDFLKKDFNNITEKEIQDEIYNIARNNNIEPPVFFKQLYNILINKDKGPKLAGFIKTIGIKKFEKIVKYYI
ncbi:lysine--tRNA ligase [Borrelia anserina]|uniref:Lysine--tRNA ligase n=2 Tax=Borrelia anserina TaxID=143 RepID=W5SPQ9_BORAN|nr:lysine--tRNA ligase [Borrelia anserina]AHH08628.1 Class 1 lysyl-tRNA synthetase [Borrelia anserina BA2]APR65088.1 lysine--tRNA ligase [Borrelia anserina Es]UPA07015.1 lysine--tRNA ligase [Borrelia anserina]